ncbi:hypothetical protein ACGFYU_32380 [Streptomyces sp. NPDC048337]|uniref:hypothetical protein n=1 Tax=Streptomyces sp. NPDC048337 TaxID=3365535 RepID=UPI0037176143
MSQSQNFQPPAPDSFTEAPAPAPAASGNIGLGIVAAVVAALVIGAIYGAIIGATKYEIGYAAIAVGAVIGLAAGKIGGRNPLLPVISVLLALAAVLGGQMFGMAMITADEAGVSTTDVLNLGISLLFDGWKENADPMTFLFFAVGGYAAFQTARKTAA